MVSAGRKLDFYGPAALILVLLLQIGAASQGFFHFSNRTIPIVEEEHPVPVKAVYPTAWALMATSNGEIVLELYGNETPVTTGNFINATRLGFYSKTVFHRVLKGFVIQGGGYSENMEIKRSPFPPIRLEISPLLNNSRGTISMARTADPNSATTQFFINLVDNSRNLGPNGGSVGGYAVFGRVIKGMDVVDGIANATVVEQGFVEMSLPLQPVVIESVSIFDTLLR
jgi:cyclophilin family peptidyl-prolyl cis-trans isomerase